MSESGALPPVRREWIGRSLEPETFDVERGAIRRFAEAIGDLHPAYMRGDIAPPTFPKTFKGQGHADLLPGIVPERKLHGGDEFIYERPLRAGDQITCYRKIEDIKVREGRLGQMTIVVMVTEGRDAAGQLVYTNRHTTIVRDV